MLLCQTRTLESSPRLRMSRKRKVSTCLRSNLLDLLDSFSASVPESPFSPKTMTHTFASVPAPEETEEQPLHTKEQPTPHCPKKNLCKDGSNGVKYRQTSTKLRFGALMCVNEIKTQCKELLQMHPWSSPLFSCLCVEPQTDQAASAAVPQAYLRYRWSSPGRCRW